ALHHLGEHDAAVGHDDLVESFVLDRAARDRRAPAEAHREALHAAGTENEIEGHHFRVASLHVPFPLLPAIGGGGEHTFWRLCVGAFDDEGVEDRGCVFHDVTPC